MTLEELRRWSDAGEIDTVLLALTDMQGRLQGKRLTAEHFLDEVAAPRRRGLQLPARRRRRDEHRRRLRDGLLGAGLRRLRDAPRPRDAATGAVAEGTAMCLADLAWADGTRRASPPRARCCARSWHAWRSAAGPPTPSTELEFLVFRDSYEDAWRKGYRDLEPANLYNVDYSLLGTARVEPLIRRIRNSMAGAGLEVENSKGECNLGQHEINFRYADALRCADDHSIYKNGAKEIAAQEGMSISFMAKFNEREGNSCHIHFSLADARGPAVRRATGRCSSRSSPASSRACAS